MFPTRLLGDVNYVQGWQWFTTADDLSQITMLSFEQLLFWLVLCLSVLSCLQLALGLVAFSASTISLKFIYLDSMKN